MGILDQKKKVFGIVAALKTLTDGLPKLKKTSSFPSINNNGDSIAFLSDLIKSLVGYEALVKETVDVLVYGLKDIEVEVKKVLKSELKSIVNCGVNPSIPDFIKSTGSGIVITVPKIDFNHILMTDPLSIGGKLLYNDLTPNLIDSSDFNTFLYKTIQNNGSTEHWGSTTSKNNILGISFEANDLTGVKPNNSLKINAHTDYDTKTLTDLNNDYVDSLLLFNVEKLVTNIVDIVFGSVSTVLNKSVNLLQADAKVNSIIDKIVASHANTIDDKVFTFSSSELRKHEELANLRKKGIAEIQGSGKINSSIPIDSLTNFNKDILSATTTEHKKAAVSKHLEIMASLSAINSTDNADIPNIKLNFIQQMVNNIIKAIVNVIISPKVMMIFIVNFKIIYGPTATFDNAIDFIKKNKTLLNNIMKSVSELIIKRLLVIALKKISELVAETALKEEIEKNKSNVTQLLSLIGVPQETLRLIKGLN